MELSWLSEGPWFIGVGNTLNPDLDVSTSHKDTLCLGGYLVAHWRKMALLDKERRNLLSYPVPLSAPIIEYPGRSYHAHVCFHAEYSIPDLHAG